MARKFVVRSREPLLLVKTTTVTRCLPPANVSIESFVHLDIVIKSLKLVFAIFVDNVCGGSLCYGMSGKELCSFAKATPKMHWAVNLAFNCNEFVETIANGEVIINSEELTTVFVAHDNLFVRRVMTDFTLLLFMERLVIFLQRTSTK